MKLSNLFCLWRAGWRLAMLLTLPLVLAACGGSGAGAQGGASASSLGGLANTGDGSAQVQLTADKTVLNSNRSAPVQLTAVVVDGNGVIVPNRPITWQVTDTVSPSGVRLEGAVTKTDATGKATASLVLSGDQGNRNVTVKVTSTDISGSVVIAVAGTSIAISGPQTVPLNGASTRFTITLKDSGGLGIAGKTLAVSSAKSNSLSATNVVTDQSGQASVDLIGTVGGADTLVASGMGTTAGFAISVASEALQVQPTLQEIPIGPAGTTVRVSYSKAGGIPPGTLVSLNSTRGTVSPAAVDISSGTATFTIASTTAGPVSLAATIGTTQGSATARYIATVPSAVDLQATPTIIGPNQSGQTSERSTLIAVVRDSNGNPVKGVIVAFTNPVDPSGGSIDPPTSITDDAGRASSTFVAGSLATPPNGVQLGAQVVGTSIAAQALLSVSRSPLFVRIGAGDFIVKNENPPTYIDRLAVLVTDATGNPIQNAEVQIRLTPLTYRTGSLCRWDTAANACLSTGSRWAIDVTTGTLNPSEDTGVPIGLGANAPGYRDGVCQAGEDTNGDRQLTPGNVASANSIATTDTTGAGLVNVAYPQQMALWTSVIVEATVKVGGSEGAASMAFSLRAPASDLNDVSKTPPFFNSPYPYFTERATCP